MLCSDFTVRLTAVTPGPVASNRGPDSLAEPLAEDAPIDLLLVPGGAGTRPGVENRALLDRLTRLAARAAHTASVCTGAALLARAGLLDHRPATTNKRAFDWVRAQGPLVDWQPAARWVRDGQITTSSGVAAGMDMALALLAEWEERKHAASVAHQMEYRWNDDPGDDPFAVAMA